MLKTRPAKPSVKHDDIFEIKLQIALAKLERAIQQQRKRTPRKASAREATDRAVGVPLAAHRERVSGARSRSSL